MNLSLPCDEWPYYVNDEGYGAIKLSGYPHLVHMLIATEWYGVVTSTVARPRDSARYAPSSR